MQQQASMVGGESSVNRLNYYLKGLVFKFSYKSSPNIWNFLGYVWNLIRLLWKLCRQLKEKFGLLFILTSGHTGVDLVNLNRFQKGFASQVSHGRPTFDTSFSSCCWLLLPQQRLAKLTRRCRRKKPMTPNVGHTMKIGTSVKMYFLDLKFLKYPEMNMM